MGRLAEPKQHKARGFVVLSMVILLMGVATSTSAYAQSKVGINVAIAYHKGGHKYNIVVKNKPGTKMELYVDDRNPTKATANKHGWATFKGVKLTSSSGKLSFTKIVKGKQKPINYTRRYTVKNGKVSSRSYISTSETTRDVTDTQIVPYTTQDKNDNDLAKGKTEVTQNGVNGVRTLTYKVTTTNGKQTSKTLISSVITTQPTPEIVEVGTYVASAPTPSPSPSPPKSCYPLSDENTCYEPGEYCRDSDHGATGLAGDGESILCTDNDGWRWEPNQ